MDKEIQILIEQFHIIAKKRWIPSVNKGLGSVGLTFEKELDKNPDDLFFPDYYGIELKCTTRYSRFPISLFSLAFDGPTFPEINRIIEKYGKFDETYVDKKVLYANLNCKNKRLVNDKYKFLLDVDELEEKLYLCVYDLADSLIERKSFVYLKSIYDHLVLKLNKLAIVYASRKNIKEIECFRYYKIGIYQLRGFDVFLELLKSGKIDVYLGCRIGRSGIYSGKYKNKNLVFTIKKDLIEELFERIYYEDYDEVTSFNNFMIMPDIILDEYE